jgi:signal transduction histidine kinase
MENSVKNSILIVDDEKINLEILLNILGDDYTIYMTKSGISAINMVNEFMPDLILLDIVMPDINGFEVLERLKKSEKTHNIPVIFISGLNSAEDEERGLALDAADYISKPFSAMNVKLRVKNQLQIVNQIRAIEQYARDFVELNAAKAATEEKGKFFAKMSHEMRTPLNAVIGLSEMILDDEEGLSEEVWDNVEQISRAGSSLLSMVNDILDISKIESNKFQLHPAEYNTLDMLNDTVTQSSMYREDKPIEFILNIDEDIPANLYGDDIRVRQILNNLLSNAYKYTKEGQVELSIKCERGNDDALWLIASVRDTGIGIPKENLGSMFTDYSRIDINANRYVTGTGLGLSITKMLVDMMEGAVSIESEYGKGSCFTVKILQKAVSAEVIGSDVIESLKQFQSYSRKRRKVMHQTRLSLPYARVLVVDDVWTNLYVTKGMLKPYKMGVDCVSSGQKAVEMIRDEKVKYNAIFMDHMMPEMDGIEAAKLIRQIGTEYSKNIPIIAFTANANTSSKEMFLSSGFQAFLPKPIEVPNLDEIIRQWVRDEEQEKQYLEEKIAGMDMEKGLERFNGDREVFMQILQTFPVNTRGLLEKMKDVNEENLAGYAINVHGIKSSCRGICAEELGSRAEALEHAAKAGSLAFVTENNPSFIEDVYKLTASIEDTLLKGGIGGEKGDKPKKEKPYREALEALKTACDDYKIEEIEKIIKEIECFEYTADEGLAIWLRENVDKMNFMEISERLSSFAI